MKEIFKAPNLNEMIASVAYLLDTLRVYRDIVESGDCNDCDKKFKCEYMPKPGQLVRYNCPFCGGEAVLRAIPGCFRSGLSSTGWAVECSNRCCVQIPWQSDHDAIGEWNRRAKDEVSEHNP